MEIPISQSSTFQELVLHYNVFTAGKPNVIFQLYLCASKITHQLIIAESVWQKKSQCRMDNFRFLTIPLFLLLKVMELDPKSGKWPKRYLMLQWKKFIKAAERLNGKKCWPEKKLFAKPATGFQPKRCKLQKNTLFQ